MPDFQKNITKIVAESIAVKTSFLEDEKLCHTLSKVTEKAIETLRNGGSLWFCGNGGSMSDAQHIAAELTGRFYINRRPFSAEALAVNTSYLTAVANDYGFEEVFARMVEAKCKKGDMLFALSTSGNSENILKAVEKAQKLELTIVGMTGKTGGKLTDKVDFLLNVPSQDTPRIQEVHILMGHILCELVEREMSLFL